MFGLHTRIVDCLRRSGAEPNQSPGAIVFAMNCELVSSRQPDTGSSPTVTMAVRTTSPHVYGGYIGPNRGALFSRGAWLDIPYTDGQQLPLLQISSARIEVKRLSRPSPATRAAQPEAPVPGYRLTHSSSPGTAARRLGARGADRFEYPHPLAHHSPPTQNEPPE
jgi:hypothetical protein